MKGLLAWSQTRCKWKSLPSPKTKSQVLSSTCMALGATALAPCCCFWRRRVPAQLGTAMLRELGMLPPHHLEPWNRCTRSPLSTLPLWGSCFSVKEKLQKRRWEEKRVSLGLFSWQTAHCPRDSTSALLAAAPSGAQNLSPRALLPGTA